MPTDNEINEAIARWCGFKYGCELIFVGTKYREDMWFTPNGDIYGKELPNFLDPIQGMGLLFKYAVPKLPHYPLIHIGFDYIDNEVVIERWDNSYDYEDWRVMSVVKGCFTDPTRALAMAIYKLAKGE